MRDRLIELIDDFIHNIDVTKWYSEEHDEGLADYLLNNGVIVPQVGDMVYQVYDIFNEKVIEELKVLEITSDTKGIKTIYASTKTGSIYCFSRDYNLSNIKFTKEEAEKALKESVQE